MFPWLLLRRRLNSASEAPGSGFVFLRRASSRFAFSLWPGLFSLSLLLALAAPAAAQTVSFSTANYAVWEGESAKVEVVLSASRRTDTTVELVPFGVSATGQDVDFIDQRITVTIPRYETRGTGTIRTVQDARKEVTEQFRLDIVTSSLPAGVTVGTPATAYVNIQDDDQDAGSLPRLSIARHGKYVPGQTGGRYAPVVEGTSAAFSVTVSTDWAAPKELTVTLEVSEDTGEGQNFVALSNEGTQTMTIHPWRDGAAKIYQVPTANDGSRWADGAVTVRLVPSDDYQVEVGRGYATVEVVDDDHPRGLILTSSTPFYGGLTMPEGGGGGYTVRLASPPSSDVTVNWARRNDGDGDGDWSNVHISPASMTFTRDNWFETQLMYVRGDRDNDGDNDRFSVVHTASDGGVSGYNGISNYMRVGVVDNYTVGQGQDSQSSEDQVQAVVPSVAVGNVAVTADDDASATATWDAVPYATSYLVEYETTSVLVDQHNYVQGVADGWTQTSWTFQHNAAEAMTLTVTITPLYDDGNGNVQQFDDLLGTATIEVEPDPEVSISADAASVTEGTNAAFTVTANPAPSAPLSVSLSVAQTGSFGVTTGAQTFNIPTSGSAPLNIATTNDNVDEANGSVTVTVSTSAGYSVSSTNGSATVAIEDNDDPSPVAAFASAAYSGGEAAGSRTVNAQVNVSPAAPSGGLSVAYAVNSSSTAGSGDYGSLSGSLNIAQGQTSGNITVTITDDALDEGAETLILDLTDGADYDLGATPQTTITIADDDGTAPPPPPPPPATPVASFASASASAAESAGTQNVTVNLSPAPSAAITLKYTLSGTATRDADYAISGVTSNSGTASVGGGDASVNIPVAITDDSVDENSETVILTLASGTGYDVGNASVFTLTITDNDDTDGGGGTDGGAGGGNTVGGDGGSGNAVAGGGNAVGGDNVSRVTLSVSPNPVLEGEEITVTVGLSQLFSSDADIPLVLTPGDAEAGDYGALASIAIDANEPNGTGVISTAADDDLQDETFTVALGTLPAGLAAGAQTSVEVTITEASVTSIESAGGEIPTAFALEQNYPNPFNPTTTIAFALDRTQHVTLAVYDLLGQEVQVLVDGVRPAARYRVPFDASNLASGTYLYVLRTEEQTAVKTMALLK